MIKVTKKKNPTDKEILKGIKIQKIPDGHQIRYKLFHNNNYIGDVWYDIHRGFVTSVEIDWELQRNGIITYVYDHIEKDQKIKLKPSTQLTDAGKAFWKNRLRKKNPTDYDFLNRIRIEKLDMLVGIRYYVWLDDLCIGVFVIQKRNNFIEEMEVWDNKYKHKGLATYMFDYIENDLKIKLVPSKYQTKAGKAFWQNRLK